MDAFDLEAAPFGGLINEDVLQQIINLSMNIELPFTAMTGEGSSGNPRGEWTVDTLADPDLTNKRIDGQDTNQNDDSGQGQRISNFHTISTKTIRVSTRADNTDNIGRAVETAYQTTLRLRELRRDNEAQYQDQNASFAGVQDTTASESAGVYSFLTTNTFRGVGGADGGFNFTTGIVDAPTNGTARPLTETLVRDAAEAVYLQGGDVDVLMSVPRVIRRLSEYMFTDSARIANLMSDVRERMSAAVASGAVNVFVTDYGVVLRMIPNRLHPFQDTDQANVGLFDMSLLRRHFLHGYRNEELAKTGLARTVQLAVDVQTRVLDERGLAVIADVDQTAPVTFS